MTFRSLSTRIICHFSYIGGYSTLTRSSSSASLATIYSCYILRIVPARLPLSYIGWVYGSQLPPLFLVVYKFLLTNARRFTRPRHLPKLSHRFSHNVTWRGHLQLARIICAVRHTDVMVNFGRWRSFTHEFIKNIWTHRPPSPLGLWRLL